MIICDIFCGHLWEIICEDQRLFLQESAGQYYLSDFMRD